MEILNELNKKFNFKYEYLRVLKVEYNTLLSYAEICFLFPENIDDISNEDRNEIIDFTTNLLNLSCDLKIKFKKSFLDEYLIKKHLVEYLKNAYPSMFAYYNENNISIEKSNNLIIVKLNLINVVYDYFIFNNLKEEVLKELNNNFIANFGLEVIKSTEQINEEILIKHEEETYNNLPKEKPVERYEVYDPVKMFGQDITPMPELIKNQKEEKTSVILSGKISGLTEKTYISKRNKLKGIDEQSYYYSFILTDHSGKIPAIYFSNKTTRKKAVNLKDGDSVLVIGDIKKDFKGNSLHIKSLSYCEIVTPQKVETEEIIQFDGKVLDEYMFVKPEIYIKNQQSNLFEILPEYNDIIKQNTFVVFDCETTGFDCRSNEIIEIGAVKIVDGKIKETFQSFICPEQEIPAEITKLTTITNEMVKDAPNNAQVIPDFYKFCEGCTLVGYNVSFDIGFIKVSGEKSGYNFNHKTIDALELTKQKMYLPRYKLGNVVEALGLKLDNAHRALADAIATAEVFLKLNEI